MKSKLLLPKGTNQIWCLATQYISICTGIYIYTANLLDTIPRILTRQSNL